MKNQIYIILKNEPLTRDVYRLVLGGDTSAFTAPGQFLDIRLPGFFLRRPISVCDWDERSVTVIYKLLGEGTRALAGLGAGARLDVLTGLGNGFDTSQSGERPAVVGGGVGIPPLYKLTKQLLSEGKRPVAVLGFNRAKDIFYVNQMESLGADVIVATADGSFGVRGFVTDALAAAGTYDYLFACGPTAMLRALDAAAAVPGQFSLEERMGCGFGACMGCTCRTENGPKRVCRDGPVFGREEIAW